MTLAFGTTSGPTSSESSPMPLPGPSTAPPSAVTLGPDGGDGEPDSLVGVKGVVQGPSSVLSHVQTSGWSGLVWFVSRPESRTTRPKRTAFESQQIELRPIER